MNLSVTVWGQRAIFNVEDAGRAAKSASRAVPIRLPAVDSLQALLRIVTMPLENQLQADMCGRLGSGAKRPSPRVEGSRPGAIGENTGPRKCTATLHTHEHLVFID